MNLKQLCTALIGLSSLTLFGCDRTNSQEISGNTTPTITLAPRLVSVSGLPLPQVDSVRLLVLNANAQSASPYYEKSVDWHRRGDTIRGIPRDASILVKITGVKIQPDGTRAIWWSGTATTTFAGSVMVQVQALSVPVSVGDTSAPVLLSRRGDSVESTDSVIRLVWKFRESSLSSVLVNGDTAIIQGDSAVWIHSWTGQTLPVEAWFRDQQGNATKDTLTVVRKSRVPTPWLMLPTGNYNDTVRVGYSTAMQGAQIEYSTNGGVTWTPYTAPILVGTTSYTTLQARATKPGLTPSAIVSSSYTIAIAEPTFSVPTGTSATDLLTVKLATETPGASIEYSLNGGITWSNYADSIIVDSTRTVSARATKVGVATSSISQATYAVAVAAPSFSFSSGSYATDHLTVRLATVTPGASIQYSLNDGTTWLNYADSMVVDSTRTVLARATKTGVMTSSVSFASYALSLPAPDFSRPTGTSYNDLLTIKLSDWVPNASIEYSTDGTTWLTYTDSVVLGNNTTIRARARKGLLTSSISQAIYSIAVAPPIFSIPTGRMTADFLTVKLTSATPEASFEYSLNGGTTWSNYADSIVVDSTRTVSARATKAGVATSLITSATYAVQAESPILSLASGEYSSYQKVFLSTTATPGAEIRYTLDGTDPTIASALFTDSILIDSTRTLKARSFRTGLASSRISSAEYVLRFSDTITSTIPEFSYFWTTPKWAKIRNTRASTQLHCTTNGQMPEIDSPLCADSVLLKDGSTLWVRSFALDQPKLEPSERIFHYLSTWNSQITYGTLTDSRDGQIYRTVRIGTQNWMAQNLNFQVDSSWCMETYPGYCDLYGRLYLWSAAMDISSEFNSQVWSGSDEMHQGVCPTGWHLPNQQEWETLIHHVDSARAADVLESRVLPQDHSDPRLRGTDDYGFRMLLPGNPRRSNFDPYADWRNVEYQVGYAATFATATQIKSGGDAGAAWIWAFSGGSVGRSGSGPNSQSDRLLSIRCVEN